MDINEEVKLLLNNFIITKEYHRDAYYKIKSKIKKIREFMTNKLGCDVIVNSSIIKLEKVPSLIDSTFKIEAFDNKKDYVFLMLIIMFLEDKAKEEQFILSNLTSFIDNTLALIPNKKINIDFKDFSTRKSLVDVMKYVTSLNVIKLIDGSDDEFKNSEDADALYQNTGISHYIVRQFRKDIFELKTPNDFLEIDNDDETNKKRFYTYRTLLFYPIFHFDEFDDDINNYFKYYHNRILNDIDEMLGGNLLIYNNLAILTSEEKNNYWPNNKKTLHDIILLVNKYIVEYDSYNFKRQELEQIFLKLHNDNKKYFSKEYREMRFNNFFNIVISTMESYKLVSIKDNEYKFSQAVNLIYGAYPEIEEESTFKQLEIDLEA